MCEAMKIPVFRVDTELPLPSHSHVGDAGVDLRSTINANLDVGERILVPSGFAFEIPPGHCGLVMPRSGLALKHGISVVNSPGLIDSGYRGEIKVTLINHGSETFEIVRGERIAQLVIMPFVTQEIVDVEALSDTARGDGGYGSTGV
jgi:dUTP diphosphatase